MIDIGMTYDLHTFCNGSDMEMTMLYRVAPIKKYNGFRSQCACDIN